MNLCCVKLLPVEIKFFHGDVQEKSIGTHAQEIVSNSDKIYWSKNKELPPGAHCLIHNQMAQLCLTQKSRPCGLSPTSASVRFRMARRRDAEHLCLISSSVHPTSRPKVTLATIVAALRPVRGPVLGLVWLPGPCGCSERAQVNEQRTSDFLT